MRMRSRFALGSYLRSENSVFEQEQIQTKKETTYTSFRSFD